MKKLISLVVMLAVVMSVVGNISAMAIIVYPGEWMGMNREDIATVQRKLKEAGYLEWVDGDFGPSTDAAVRNFQSDYGLKADGWVGEMTKAALGITREMQEEPDKELCYPPLAGEGTDRRILVSLSKCRVKVFYWDKGQWIKELDEACVVGAANSQTPMGRFKIQAKEDGFWKNGRYYAYMTSFYGDYGFHSVPYTDTPKNPDAVCVDSELGVAKSLGCIRLSREAAEDFRNLVDIGDDVYIYF